MRWKARGAGLLVGVVGTVAALATADNAEQHTTVGWVVIGAVVVGFAATGVAMMVLRRKVAAGWRPGPATVGLATAAGIGGVVGVTVARLGPPELAAPLLGVCGGVFLGAAFLPGVPDVPGERTGEQIVEDMEAADRADYDRRPWSPWPSAAGPGLRRRGLRYLSGVMYGFALVCLLFVVIGPVRPEDTRLDFALYALVLVAIGASLTGLSWLWHRYRHRDRSDRVTPEGRPRAGHAPRRG